MLSRLFCLAALLYNVMHLLFQCLYDMKNRLHRALEMLPKGERELLQAIYFQGKTEEKYGNEVGISQRGVSYQYKKALSNLRTINKALGGF